MLMDQSQSDSMNSDIQGTLAIMLILSIQVTCKTSKMSTTSKTSKKLKTSNTSEEIKTSKTVKTRKT
jgi:hypothetical protein